MNDSSDYVFKSSRIMAELAIQMDVEGPDNILQENVYFDTTHRRVHGFKSLRLWLFYPTMRKVIRLASMDIRTENTKDIALFFNFFNEILQKVSGNPEYKFNPCYFLCNEGDANHKAIKTVYGEDFCKTRVVVASGILEVMPPKNPEFYQIIRGKYSTKPVKCYTKSTTTTSQYNILKGLLEELPKKHPTLHPWMQCWYAGSSHIFAPFRGGGLPGVNKSEIGNAGWKPYNTLRLVHLEK